MKSLKYKLMARFTILLVIITVVLSATSIYYSSKALLEENSAALETFSIEISKSVESEFNIITSQLSFLANHPMFSGDEDMDDEEVKSMFETEGENNALNGFGLFETDGSGRYYDIASGEFITSDLSSEVYFSQLADNESFVIVGQPDFLDEEVIMYVIPRTDRDTGDNTGTLIAYSTSDSFKEIISAISYGTDGFAFLVSENSIISGDEHYVALSEDVINDILNTEISLVNYTEENIDYISSATPVIGTPFSVVISVELESVMAAEGDLVKSLVIAGLVFLIIAIIVIYMISSSITKPIVEITKKGQELSNLVIKQDEDYKVTKDEIGDLRASFITITQSLGNIVKSIDTSSNSVGERTSNLNEISHQLSTKSELITMSVDEISVGVTEQAEDINRMMSDVNVLSENIDEEQNMIKDIDQLSHNMSSLKEQGLGKVQTLVDKTEENKTKVSQINDVILSTNEDAINISEAVSMIETIADQTSLLALNANIEAARAGEHGRGFAIVADEIRKLAVESERFASEIKNITKGLTAKTKDSVGIIQEMVDYQEVQEVSVNDTVDSFNGIADEIVTLQNRLEVLMQSGMNMREKNNNIVRSIENLSAISEESAATSQNVLAVVNEQYDSILEISEETDSLNQLVKDLKGMIEKFDVQI